MKKKKPENKTDDGFKNFANLLGEVANVPHAEIKAKLEAEKRAKKKKPSK